MLPSSLTARLCDHFSSPIQSSEVIGGGDSCSVACVYFENAQRVLVKFITTNSDDLFNAEVRGLNLLRQVQALVVPEVLLTEVSQHGALLVLEYIEPSQKDSRFFKELAEGLAALHQIVGESYGLDHNNFIGRNEQINTLDENWGSFFVRQRLEVQVALGQKQGWLSPQDSASLTASSAALVDCLNESAERPVLLHGDLWSGNVMATARGPALIDPAVYYGSREADLAFSELFGGFPEEFYQHYDKILPRKSGFQDRKKIYNLYHILNHANLFGGHYCTSARQDLASLRNF